MMSRPLDATDAEILIEATLLNVNWCGPRFTRADVLNTPELAHYTRILDERGDFGHVLFDDTGWVSVVWLVFLYRSDPGYAYVADGIPELSLCTRPGHRGRGYGRQLLDRATRDAHSRDLDAVALSVEAENPARRLDTERRVRPAHGYAW